MWRMASRTPAVRQVAPVARRRTCVEWVAAGVPAVLVLGWFWLPGLVVLRVLAFRGLGLVAVAPLVTLGVLGATAILAERAGVAWGPATAVGGTAIAVGIAWLARRLDRGGQPAPVQQAGSARWMVAAVAVGVAAQIVPTFVGMQRPGRLLDAYDAVVHLNTIRYVQESGSASSLTVSGVYSAGQDTGFYPAAWHGVTALVPAWPDPATVFTIAAFLPTAVAWTTGIAFLTRSVFPGRPRAACWAALLSGAGLTLPQVLAQQQAEQGRERTEGQSVRDQPGLLLREHLREGESSSGEQGRPAGRPGSPGEDGPGQEGDAGGPCDGGGKEGGDVEYRCGVRPGRHERGHPMPRCTVEPGGLVGRVHPLDGQARGAARLLHVPDRIEVPDGVVGVQQAARPLHPDEGRHDLGCHPHGHRSDHPAGRPGLLDRRRLPAP